eukprot:jgi/Mesvir1/26842/Mv20595-RA.1
MEDLVLLQRPKEGIAIVTLNRPSAMNSLTVPMLRKLASIFNSLRGDNTVRVAILTGAGRGFCAGIDLSAAQTVFQGDDVANSNQENDPVVQMEACPFPIIGAINGHAVTGGFEIALACDILVASTTAKFADTHCKFGLMPAWGLSQKLPRLIGANRAREVSFTAQPIDAEIAERWGLVSRVVAPDQLMPLAMRLAEQIVGNHGGLVRGYKSVLQDGLAGTLESGRRLEVARAKAYYKQMSPGDFKKMQEFIEGRSKTGKLTAKL